MVALFVNKGKRKKRKPLQQLQRRHCNVTIGTKPLQLSHYKVMLSIFIFNSSLSVSSENSNILRPSGMLPVQIKKAVTVVLMVN